MDSEEADPSAVADEAKVFLSYSRKDREAAQGIADALRSRSFGVFKDTDDILPTEEWRDRLKELIEEADTIVFLLSPHSATSEVCAWEVEYANELNKRIAPIVIEDVAGDAIPPLLARLNFIFCTPRDPFADAVDTLVSALNLDIDWIREHTRLNGLAARWRKAGNASHLLLRGQDIIDAERWRDERPKEAPAVTPLQAEFITASRRDAVRRQRRTVGVSIAMAVFSIGLAALAYLQSIEADRQRVIADANAEEAEAERAEAETQRGRAEENARVAEAERAEAQAQRDRVARQLTAQSLRTGDFATAAGIVRDLAPQTHAMQTVLASLIAPENAARRKGEVAPFRLNGKLYLSQRDAAPIELPLDFSANRWLRHGETILLISDGGQIRQFDHAGTALQDHESSVRSRLCKAIRGREGLTILSWGKGAYSAGSQSLLVTRVPNEPGPITREDYFAGHDPIILDAPDGPVSVDVYETLNACADFALGRIGRDEWFPVGDFALNLELIDDVAFPGAAEEDTLWSGERRPELTTEDKLRQLSPYGFTPALAQYLRVRENGEFVQGYVSDIVVGGAVSGLKVPWNYGGTGGEESQFCLVTSASKMNCADLGGFGQMRLALNPTNEWLAVYGQSISYEGNTFSVWILTAEGGVMTTGKTEEVLSASFGPDGTFAYLENGALVLHAPDGEESYRGPRPGAATAVGWTADGRLVLFGDDGVHVGSGPEDLAFTPLAPPPPTSISDAETPYWVTAEADGPVVALGYGADFVLFDTAMMAPISGAFEPGHEQFEGASILSRTPEGGWRMEILGTEYLRRSATGIDLDRAFDAEAVFE